MKYIKELFKKQEVETVNVHELIMKREWREKQAKRLSNGLWWSALLVMAFSGTAGLLVVVLFGGSNQ